MSGVVYAETVRRHVASLAYWGYLALVVIVAAGMSRFNSPAAMWPTLVSLLAIIAGAQLIGPEFSSGTLQLILVKPVTRAAYLLSRVAGAVSVAVLAAMIAGAVELLCRALWLQPLHARAIGAAVLGSAAESLLAVALLAFFGSFTRAYFNVAIYVVLQVALGVGLAVAGLARRLPFVQQGLQQIMNNLYPEAPRVVDGRWMLLVLSNAAVALVLACLFFRRREVPYGAD